MEQALKFHIFDFSWGGSLSETLAEILRTSFGSQVELQIEVVNELRVELEPILLKKLEVSNPRILLVVLDKHQVPQVAKLIQSIKAKKQKLEIVGVPAECDSGEIIDLLRSGASDFISPPLNISATVPRIHRLLEKTKGCFDSTQFLKAKIGIKQLVGKAPSFLAETSKIPLLANCDGRVLILGETGTGKELFARAIHYLSPRMTHPFVPVTCGAIPAELMENELFGHHKGAFSSATTSKSGLIREAEGGTLFLDEIDSLPLLAQTKLLRFLQEGEYRPLGSTKLQQSDVRVIAASNLNLGRAVKEGKLRQDLYYRLDIVRLNLPPLRDRREDIPLLAHHFLGKYAREFRRSVTGLGQAAMQKLILYDWPGNIRELENTIERAVMLSGSEDINDTEIFLPDAEMSIGIESLQESKSRIITNFERSYIQGLMVTYNGNVSHAARAAKKNRRAFWELIRKHDIDVTTFRKNRWTEKSR